MRIFKNWYYRIRGIILRIRGRLLKRFFPKKYEHEISNPKGIAFIFGVPSSFIRQPVLIRKNPKYARVQHSGPIHVQLHPTLAVTMQRLHDSMKEWKLKHPYNFMKYHEIVQEHVEQIEKSLWMGYKCINCGEIFEPVEPGDQRCYNCDISYNIGRPY